MPRTLLSHALPLLTLFATAVSADTIGVTLHLEAPPELCEHARVNDENLRRDASGVFAPIPLRGNSVEIHCKNKVSIAIPNAEASAGTTTQTRTLKLVFDKNGQPDFSGAHAELNTHLNAPLSLSLRALYPLLRGDEAALVAERKRRQAADQTRLATLRSLGLNADLLEREQTRTAFNHAHVRGMLPFFRWRETAQAKIIADPELPEIIRALPLRDPRWWSLPEFNAFAESWIHESARALLLTDAKLKTGDHRWLRASLAAIDARFPDATLKQRLRDEQILKHVDEDASAGMDAILAEWRRNARPEALAKLEAALREEPDTKTDPSFVYQTLAGSDLRVHVLQPTQPSKSPVPAVLWFHGGSSTRGAWWHMPIVAKVLRENGVAVIGVELSTQNRFDRDADQLRDADRAWQWLMANAEKLQFDPQRLGVAGFSSGAGVALTTATRGIDIGKGQHKGGRVWPATAMVMGACADPLAKEEDGWFRKSLAGRGDPALFTPMGNLRAGLPPVLAIHGTADEYCSYETLTEFAEKSRALGNRVEVASIVGASHFFVFYHRPGIATAREAITAHLKALHWLPAAHP